MFVTERRFPSQFAETSPFGFGPCGGKCLSCSVFGIGLRGVSEEHQCGIRRFRHHELGAEGVPSAVDAVDRNAETGFAVFC